MAILDLILLNLKTPDFDGYEILEILKSSENTADIPGISEKDFEGKRVL